MKKILLTSLMILFILGIAEASFAIPASITIKSFITGCYQSGGDCVSGRMWGLDNDQPSTSSYFRLGSYTGTYKAHRAYEGDSLVLNHSRDNFPKGFIGSFIKKGNRGNGKTVVWDDPGPSAVPAAVAPEPMSSILFVVGGAIFGFRRFWNKRKSI
ncbi:MAG TPA: hypothetical protein DDX85_02760 [Nitrospiraceae bacterium]|nr:hypothetical protein [Nitrospiraceae bacterium]